MSLELSAVSAALAGVLGLVGTVALVSSPDRIVRRLVTTACGVLANTGGVPLAFAFIATIGNAGIATHVLAELGFNPYDHGFTLYSFTGLVIVYLYFLLPLGHLAHAAAGRGAAPRMAGGGGDARGEPTEVLAEGGSSGAHTAVHRHSHGAVHGRLRRLRHRPSTDDRLGPAGADRDRALLAGNVVTNQANLGDALGFGMIVIVGAAGALYVLVQRRTARWLR